MKFVSAIAALCLCLCACLKAQPTVYTVRSLGNSTNGNDNGQSIQEFILDQFVGADGTVYATTTYSENNSGTGIEFGIYRDGIKIGVAGASNHNGYLGGRAVCANATSIWYGQIATHGGTDPTNTTYPDAGKWWFGVTRRLRSSPSTASTFTGAKGGLGGTLNSFLLVDEVASSNDVGVDSLARISGCAADNSNLYLGSTTQNKIMVYNASTMAPASPASFAFTAPGKMVLDGSGNLWVVRTSNNHIYKCVAGTCTDSISASGMVPTALAISNTGKLMIGDSGTSQQVLFWDISGTPSQTSAFGVSGGAFGSATLTDLTLINPSGVGTDAAGNIYVANGTIGTRLQKFTQAGVKVWELQGLTFAEAGACDPTDDCATRHTQMERYSSAGVLTGITIDALTYPTDIRLPRAPDVSGLSPQYATLFKMVSFGGQKYAYYTDQYGSYLAWHRWNAATGKLVPAGMIVPIYNITYFAGIATDNGFKIWTDANGDGLVQSGEVAALPAETNQWWGWDIDANGDVYQAVEGTVGVRRFAMTGLNGANNPQYPSYNNLGCPTPFTQIERAKILPDGTMWVGGYTATHPKLDESGPYFALVGTEIGKYPAYNTVSTIAQNSFGTATPSGTPRNDANITAGFTFTVNQPTPITRLGRLYLSGNTHDHPIKLWDATNTTTPLASATILAASASDGSGYKWVSITPLTLVSGHTYAIAIDETVGQDTWSDAWSPSGLMLSRFTPIGYAFTSTVGNYPSTQVSNGFVFDSPALEVSTGDYVNKTPALRITLPYEIAPSYRFVKSMAVAGNRVFAGMAKTTSTEGVYVYDGTTGRQLTILQPRQLGPLQPSDIDGNEMITAYKHADGSVTFMAEDNLFAHVLEYTVYDQLATITGITPQQVVASVEVTDPAQCTAVVYLDSGLTVKAHDTDNSIFSGSENCVRPYNIVEGKRIYAVVGRRTSEASGAGLLVSRSLQTATPHWLKVTDTAASTSTVVAFVTANIAWGATHIEEVPYSAIGFSHRAYEDLDWSDAALSKTYIDPMSGVAFKRIARGMMGSGGNDGNSPLQEYAFLDVFDINSAWTNPNNAKSTSTSGPFATYAGTTRDPLFLPVRIDSPANWYRVANIPEDYRAVLYGSGVSTGNVEDLKVLVCLAVNYIPATNVCTNEIEATLPTTAGSVSIPAVAQGQSADYPTFRLAGWGLTRQPSREQISNVGCPSASVSASMVTIGASSNCDVLPLNIAPGMLFGVGATWYHVGTLGTNQSFTLAESSVSTSGAWKLANFGFRIRKKTTVNNQISVAATYSVAYDTTPDMPANSIPDFCSSLTTSVDKAADGTTTLNPPKTGRLCFVGTSHKYLILLLSDGETRYLSNADRYDQGCGGVATNIPLGAWSVTNPLGFYATHMGDSGCHWSLFEVTYDSASCHWAANTGNKFHTVSAPTDCLTWTDKTPRLSGLSVQQQLAAPAAANLIWDPSFNVAGFGFKGISGNYAIFNYFTAGQDGPCITATFNLTTYRFDALWDSISGSLPGLRFATCHSDGANLTDHAGSASFGYIIAGGKNDGYVGGPYLLQPPTAKSLDGGATWNADTSLTNTDAGTCIGGGTGIVGTVQCVKLKLPSPTPCNRTATGLDAGKWPCSWHSGWSAPVTPIIAEDWISRLKTDGGIDGKNEADRILSVAADPGVSGGVIIEILRWSVCQDVLFFNHIDWPGGSTMENGWTPLMVPKGECGTAITWMNLANHNATRVDSTAIVSAHDSIGRAPDRVRTLQVGAGASRVGILPAAAGVTPDYTMAINKTAFNGIIADSGVQVEQYPSLGNWACLTNLACALYRDFRAINPDLGTIPEDLVKVWDQAYTLVSGQKFTYQVNVKDSFNDFKSRPANVFGSRSVFVNKSGPGSSISDADLWSYCQAYKVNECRSGSAVGDMFVVAPTAYISKGGCTSDATWGYTPCVVPLWSNAGWLIEQNSQENDAFGSKFRRITMAQAGPAAHFQYSTPHAVPDVEWSFVRASVPNGILGLPILLKHPPPSLPDSIARDGFIKMPLPFPAGSGYIRIRFGYSENAPDASHPFYCMSRLEECVTDASVTPFAFASAFPSTSGSSDSLTATNCTAGCTINVPLLSGRVVTYRIEKSANGTTGWVAGVLQVAPVK